MTEPTEQHRETARATIELAKLDANIELVSGKFARALTDHIVQALVDAFTAGRADRQAEDAEIARDPANLAMIGGSTGSAHVTAKRIANAILAPSSGSYEARIRAEIAAKIVAACPLADPNSTHPITIEGESCYGCEPFLAAIQRSEK